MMTLYDALHEIERLRRYQLEAADRFDAVVRQRDEAEAEMIRLRAVVESLAARVTAQRELLSRKAEVDHARD